MDEIFFVGLIASAFRLGTPILFAALGETVSQRSGVLNVGIEGIMLVGAFTGVWGAFVTGSAWAGLAVAMVAGVAMAAVHAVLCLRLHLDQIVAGIGLTVLGLGLSGFGNRLVFGTGTATRTPVFDRLDFGWLSQVDFIGPAFFQHHALVYVGVALAIGTWCFLTRTGWGLVIRGVGEDPVAANAAGVGVIRTRTACVLWGGALAGAGGAYLSVGQIGSFVEDMVAGRGFIAIACVVYGRWNPLGVLMATLFFGAADAAQIRLQPLFPGVPYQFFVMLPYVLAVGALVFLSRRSRLPGGLARPYIPPH